MTDEYDNKVLIKSTARRTIQAEIVVALQLPVGATAEEGRKWVEKCGICLFGAMEGGDPEDDGLSAPLVLDEQTVSADVLLVDADANSMLSADYNYTLAYGSHGELEQPLFPNFEEMLRLLAQRHVESQLRNLDERLPNPTATQVAEAPAKGVSE